MAAAPPPSARRQTALITGASSGIGAELAKVFAQHGYDLVLVARTESALASLAGSLQGQHGVSVRLLPTDLAVPAAPEEVFAALQRDAVPVDVLVNNAGFGTYGFFAETDLAAELQMLQVNVVALTHLTKLFLREMLERRRGKILNVASTAAYQPGPRMAVYYATKAYVLSFSEALANELGGTGVTVTTLCPGPTASGFQQQAQMDGPRLMSRRIMDATTVARIGFRGLMRGQTVVIPGLTNRLLAFSTRLAPRRLSAEVVRRLHEHVGHR